MSTKRHAMLAAVLAALVLAECHCGKAPPSDDSGKVGGRTEAEAKPPRQAKTTIAPEVKALNDQLFPAAKTGDVAKLKELLGKGADVNAEDKDRLTPLHAAAANGHKSAVEFLIAGGGNLHLAENALGLTPLHAAASGDHGEIVELLLAHGMDIDLRAKTGWTPLHVAAVSGSTGVAELLLARGAEINPKDKKGRTPLDWALAKRRRAVADILRRHGGKPAKELP